MPKIPDGSTVAATPEAQPPVRQAVKPKARRRKNVEDSYGGLKWVHLRPKQMDDVWKLVGLRNDFRTYERLLLAGKAEGLLSCEFFSPDGKRIANRPLRLDTDGNPINNILA